MSFRFQPESAHRAIAGSEESVVRASVKPGYSQRLLNCTQVEVRFRPIADIGCKRKMLFVDLADIFLLPGLEWVYSS